MITVERMQNYERGGTDYHIFVPDDCVARVHPAALLQEENVAAVLLNLGTVAVWASKEQQQEAQRG